MQVQQSARAGTCAARLLLGNACSHGWTIHPSVRATPCHGLLVHVEGCGWGGEGPRTVQCWISSIWLRSWVSLSRDHHHICCCCTSSAQCVEMLSLLQQSSCPVQTPEVFDQSWSAAVACRCRRAVGHARRHEPAELVLLRSSPSPGPGAQLPVCPQPAYLRACASGACHLCTALHGARGLNLVPVVGPFRRL